MTVLDVQVAASADDGESTNASDFFTAHTTNKVGNVVPYTWHGWYRFTGLVNLGGATINVAYIRLYGSAAGNAGNPLTKLYADDSAAPVAPTNYLDYDGRPLTTASVDWDGVLTAGAWNNSPSIAAIIQELVNSYDPSSILILHKDDGSPAGSNHQQRWDSYDGDPTKAPKLHLEYVEAPGLPVHVVEIDWNGDGDYSDALENVTPNTYSAKWHRGFSRDLGATPAGTLELVLRNQGGTYNPDTNANIRAGRPVRVRSTSPVAKTHFTGFIEEIELDWDPAMPTVHLYCVDRSGTSTAAKKLRLAFAQNVAAGTAIGNILTEAGWPGGDRSLDTGQTTFPVLWVHEEEALEAIRRICEAEDGHYYVRGDGYFVYEDRHHRLKGAHLTAQSTFDNIADAPPKRLSRLRDARDEVRIGYHVRVAQATAELWRLRGDVPIIRAGESATYYAVYSDPSDAITPAATTDYTFNSESGGGGTNLTSSLSLVVTKYGRGMKIVATSAAAVDGYVTLLKVRGDAYTDPNPGFRVVGSGDRSLQIDNEFQQKPLEAQSQAEWLQSLLAPPPQPLWEVVFVGNKSITLMEDLLNRDLSDRIAFDDDQVGINDEFFIEDMVHEVNEYLVHTVTYILATASDLAYAALGYGKLGSTFRLAH